MMRLLTAMLLLPGLAEAESLIATRTLRAQTILAQSDVVTVATDIPGSLSAPEDAIGMEARVTLYAGRPIRPADLGPPAIIDRNQIVPLAYTAGGLSILTEGRALGRGGVGDMIRVMNLGSRTTIAGRVTKTGTVQVGFNF